MKKHCLIVFAIVVTFASAAFSQERIENLATRFSEAFTSRKLASLDKNKVYFGSIKINVEHSIADGTDRRSFTSFKSAAAWLMRNRRDTSLQAGGLESCKKGTCTYSDDTGMLHNSLYLRKITYGTKKGRPYIKAIYFIDGD